MDQYELELEYDEETTVLDLVLELKEEDFQGVKFKNFKDDIENRTLVTYNHIPLDLDVVISQNFKTGEKLLIQFKINFNRDIEYLVYDKTMALDMLFHLNSIKNDNGSSQIQNVY